MKFYVSCILILSTFFVFAQTWQATEIPPNSRGQRYDDVFFLNENLGWAANGFFAAVYKTEDGGKTWAELLTEAQLGTSHYFRNIEFLDANTGFLGSLDGKFYRSTDGGENWATIDNINPTPPAICGLETVGQNTIFGCGAFFQPAYIIKSEDKGENWISMDMSALANALVEIQFVDENTGYAAGSDANGAVVLKTEDGGISWRQIFNSNIAGEYVWKLQILKDKPNVVFGAVESIEPNKGQLIKTSDAGTNWQSFDAPETHLQAVGFIDENTGWVGGHTTGFHQTTDGGQTWTNLGVGNNLNRIVILDDDLAYGAGTTVYKFTDETLNVKDLQENALKSLNVVLDENPVLDYLKFSIDFKSTDNLLIELYSIDGKFIKQLERKRVSNTNQSVHFKYNVSNLQAGFYFLSIHNNFNKQSIKFIKD